MATNKSKTLAAAADTENTEFTAPFADAGDRSEVPTEIQSTGEVSWEQGFGQRYALNPKDEGGLSITREKFNQIMFLLSKKILNVQNTDLPALKQWVIDNIKGSFKPLTTNLNYTVGPSGDYTTLGAALEAASAYIPVIKAAETESTSDFKIVIDLMSDFSWNEHIVLRDLDLNFVHIRQQGATADVEYGWRCSEQAVTQIGEIGNMIDTTKCINVSVNTMLELHNSKIRLGGAFNFAHIVDEVLNNPTQYSPLILTSNSVLSASHTDDGAALNLKFLDGVARDFAYYVDGCNFEIIDSTIDFKDSSFFKPSLSGEPGWGIRWGGNLKMTNSAFYARYLQIRFIYAYNSQVVLRVPYTSTLGDGLTFDCYNQFIDRAYFYDNSLLSWYDKVLAADNYVMLFGMYNSRAIFEVKRYGSSAAKAFTYFEAYDSQVDLRSGIFTVHYGYGNIYSQLAFPCRLENSVLNTNYFPAVSTLDYNTKNFDTSIEFKGAITYLNTTMAYEMSMLVLVNSRASINHAYFSINSSNSFFLNAIGLAGSSLTYCYLGVSGGNQSQGWSYYKLFWGISSTIKTLYNNSGGNIPNVPTYMPTSLRYASIGNLADCDVNLGIIEMVGKGSTYGTGGFTALTALRSNITINTINITGIMPAASTTSAWDVLSGNGRFIVGEIAFTNCTQLKYVYTINTLDSNKVPIVSAKVTGLPSGGTLTYTTGYTQGIYAVST